MQKVKMLRNLVGVQKLGKSSQRNPGDLFVQADVAHNTGVIMHVGEDLTSKFTVGQKVIVGNQREEVRINGADIMVMKEENIFAFLEEDNDAVIS